MFSVVLVCTGNTCRSPLAELIVRRRLDALGESAEVGSAGLGAVDGAPASSHAQFVAQDRGADLSRHQSRRLTRMVIDDADLVVTMTAKQKGLLLERHSGALTEVVTLGELAGEDSVDVADPYGGSLEQYEATYEEIERLVDLGLPELRRRVKSKQAAS